MSVLKRGTSDDTENLTNNPRCVRNGVRQSLIGSHIWLSTRTEGGERKWHWTA